ncbi:MAG: DNA translocase FtsK [Clostridiales bacterium]|nr:DNA translocase FtsK [Clostridiales bacterium]
MATAKKTRKSAMQTRREVWGVVLVALGVFMGICLYAGAVGLIGETITDVLFGICGVFAYAVPPVLLFGGVLFIAYAESSPQRGRTVLILLGVLLVMTLLHAAARPRLDGGAFFSYIREAYIHGETLLKGGGALGALVSYPLLLLTGEAGAYIFTIAGLLIIILLVTRLSLRETGRRVGSRVKAGLRHANALIVSRKQNLYTETIMDQADEPIKGGPARTDRSRRAHRFDKGALADEDGGITFIPSEGPLQKREEAPARSGAKRKAPEDELPPETDDAPSIVYYKETPPPADEPDNLYPATLRTAKRMAARRNTVLDVYEDPEPQKNTIAAQKRGAWREEGQEAAFPPARPGQTAPVRVTPEEGAPEEGAPEETAPIPVTPYVPPPCALLNPSRASFNRSSVAPAETAKLLIETLNNFNVSARVVNISVGPVITLYELAPAPGVRVNKITALSDDIALALAAPRVRIEAPIPGKAAVGIEVPNKDTAMVVLRDIVDSREFKSAGSPTTLALGKDIAGRIVVADLAKMPHLLIAGATGSGKSVCINDIIISLVYKCTPQELQLILVDPKVVELSAFGSLPHLRAPVVTDPKKAAGALGGGVREMTERYKLFAKLGARDLERYNELMPENKLPKLAIIIDELADLMMVAPDTVEDSICRIAQLGRAAGIHLIVATQRPSADIITGLIKANIPSRIAFAVSSAIDSRIILDNSGAEKLLGRGDMLFHPNGAGKPVRVQGAFVGDEEVERVVNHFRQQALAPTFDERLIEEMAAGPVAGDGAESNGRQDDELLGEAVRVVLDSGQASISMIQRRLRVGYARAARLVDIMEQRGYVSGFDGSKPRKLLITRAQFERIFHDVTDETGARP